MTCKNRTYTCIKDNQVTLTHFTEHYSNGGEQWIMSSRLVNENGNIDYVQISVTEVQFNNLFELFSIAANGIESDNQNNGVLVSREWWTFTL